MGAGRPDSAGETNANHDADEEHPGGPNSAEYNERVQDKDPKSNANDWEKEVDLSHVEDERLRVQVLEMLRTLKLVERVARNDPSDGTPHPT